VNRDPRFDQPSLDAQPPDDDQFSWELIEFVVSWAPYGGAGREETFPRFGLGCHELQVRFHDTVSRLVLNHDIVLSPRKRELLQRAIATVGLHDTAYPGTTTAPSDP